MANQKTTMNEEMSNQRDDWLGDARTGDAHRFQSMHGTDSCWHCDSDAYHHNYSESEARAWAKYGGCTCMGHGECNFCKER